MSVGDRVKNDIYQLWLEYILNAMTVCNAITSLRVVLDNRLDQRQEFVSYDQ
jgi:hypothetical protein